MSNKVVLWSGGYLSTAILLYYLKNGDTVYPVYIDYGQASSNAQLNSCRTMLSAIRKYGSVADSLCGLSSCQVSNLHNGVTGLLLVGIGLAKAKEYKADLLIGSLADDLRQSLFSSRLMCDLHDMDEAIIFPFISGVNEVYTKNTLIPLEAYTWNCENPIKRDGVGWGGVWVPCKSCAGCLRSEVYSKIV